MHYPRFDRLGAKLFNSNGVEIGKKAVSSLSNGGLNDLLQKAAPISLGPAVLRAKAARTISPTVSSRFSRASS